MTSGLHRQNELKLDILQSLARSQRALADIAETLAPVMTASLKTNPPSHAASSDQVAKQILERISSLSQYQHALAQKINGIDIRQVKRGKPGKPWLASTPHFLKYQKV